LAAAQKKSRSSVSREATVKSKRALVSRFVRVMTESINIYKTEKAWSKTLLQSILRMDDPESLERT